MSDNTASGGELSASERFFELYDRMIGDVEIPAVLRHVAEVVCSDFEAERASVYLIDEQTQQLESVAVIGNVARTIRVPIDAASMAGFCAMTRRSFLVPDAYADLSAISPDLRFDSRWDKLNDFRTRDVMCAPAVFKDRVMGVVQAVNSKAGVFSAESLAAMTSISRLVGYALYHARLYDDLATLKRLEKEKAGFIRVMVHELKSPVAGARMLTDALKSVADKSSPQQLASMAERIGARMDQMSELITDMLELAQVKAGTPLGKIEVLDLTSETDAVCAPYHEQAQQKDLDLTVNLPPDALNVRFDSQGYRLIVSNLVSNAIKYTPSGGVTVELAPKSPWAVLKVSDTGMGIPEADLPRLFTEFFRASNAKKSNIQGTGVGLAGAKQIIDRFGGELAIDTRQDEGSTFTVRLPLHIQ